MNSPLRSYLYFLFILGAIILSSLITGLGVYMATKQAAVEGTIAFLDKKAEDVQNLLDEASKSVTPSTKHVNLYSWGIELDVPATWSIYKAEESVGKNSPVLSLASGIVSFGDWNNQVDFYVNNEPFNPSGYTPMTVDGVMVYASIVPTPLEISKETPGGNKYVIPLSNQAMPGYYLIIKQQMALTGQEAQDFASVLASMKIKK